MSRTKSAKKYYLVLSKDRNYTYGAFPHTKQGEKDAKAFAKRISKERNEDLYVTEK
tara:strand:- start:8519 stop:8686 length:168 start_codon:yes stop_codon:yes gene_type:complete